ncbi:MAG: ParA family protein, partial [Oscillospiraceae bacterium]
LDTLLLPIKNKYDYIIIDCRPSLGILTENAVIVADELIVPSEAQFFSTKGIQLLFDEIEKIKRRKNPTLKIAGILPTKVDFRTSIAKEFIDAVKEIFNGNIKVFSPIPINTKISECNDGKNIYEYDKNGKGVIAYKKFIDEYLK